MDGTDVHPIRGTAGTARGAGTDRSNERLGLRTRSLRSINKANQESNCQEDTSCEKDRREKIPNRPPPTEMQGERARIVGSPDALMFAPGCEVGEKEEVNDKNGECAHRCRASQERIEIRRSLHGGLTIELSGRTKAVDGRACRAS